MLLLKLLKQLKLNDESYNLLYRQKTKVCYDQWVWEADDNREFLVKSMRRLLALNRGSNDLNPMNYFKWVPFKVRSFVWKVGLNRIPSKVALSSLRVHIGYEECSFCFGNQESSNHVLPKCCFAFDVWVKISKWCGRIIPLSGYISDCLDYYSVMVGSKANKETIMVVLMALV